MCKGCDLLLYELASHTGLRTGSSLNSRTGSASITMILLFFCSRSLWPKGSRSLWPKEATYKDRLPYSRGRPAGCFYISDPMQSISAAGQIGRHPKRDARRGRTHHVVPYALAARGRYEDDHGPEPSRRAESPQRHDCAGQSVSGGVQGSDDRAGRAVSGDIAAHSREIAGSA